jgi:WD40 repeat protein
VLVASGSQDRTVKLWEARTGRLLATMAGHTGGVRSVAFAPDGTLLVSAGNDGSILIWSVHARRGLATLRALPDGDWITYTPEGHFIGSDGITEKVMMAFEYEFAGSKMRERACTLSPNPAKVAEALQEITRSTRVPERRQPPLKHGTLADAPPKLLPPGAAGS